MNISIINESISCLTTESQATEQLKDMLAASIFEGPKRQICKHSNHYQRSRSLLQDKTHAEMINHFILLSSVFLCVYTIN